MFTNFLAPASCDVSDSTGLSEGQKTALKTAWTLIKDNSGDHAGKIFAKFFEQNPEYLRFFFNLGNDAMHQHAEKVLLSLGTLIEDGLREPEMFNQELQRIAKFHQNLCRQDVVKLNAVIKDHLLAHLAKHKTKTFEDALNLFFTKIEDKFEDSFDVNEEL